MSDDNDESPMLIPIVKVTREELEAKYPPGPPDAKFWKQEDLITHLLAALKEIAEINCRCGWSGPCGCGERAVDIAADALRGAKP